MPLRAKHQPLRIRPGSPWARPVRRAFGAAAKPAPIHQPGFPVVPGQEPCRGITSLASRSLIAMRACPVLGLATPHQWAAARESTFQHSNLISQRKEVTPCLDRNEWA